MKIFPKCMTGRIPFISYEGQVLPCCWIGIKYGNEKLKNTKNKFIENIFSRPEFNLYNNSYQKIVTSDEWLLSLEKLLHINYEVCHLMCNKMIMSKNRLESDKTTINNKYLFEKNRIDTWEAKNIQIELTNRCSLKCEYCPRLIDKQKSKDIDIKVIKDLLDCKNWEIVIDVGNYGDSVFYKYYHEFLSLLIDKNIIQYNVHVAATGRSRQWWDNTLLLYKKLADNGTTVEIKFGIDGLEDTSKLHRIGQNWDEITYAMKKAAENGCKSIWKFIPFSFNEHQIDLARSRAKEWNVDFVIEPSDRFKSNDINRPKNENLYIRNDN